MHQLLAHLPSTPPVLRFLSGLILLRLATLRCGRFYGHAAPAVAVRALIFAVVVMHPGGAPTRIVMVVPAATRHFVVVGMPAAARIVSVVMGVHVASTAGGIATCGAGTG